MTDKVVFHFDIDGNNFTSAGEASVKIKKLLREMGFSPDTIRRVSVAMYEGEINMVIHANGGAADVEVYDDEIVMCRRSLFFCRPCRQMPSWSDWL